MIQPPPVPRFVWFSLLLAGAAAGCARSEAVPPPRTGASAAQARRFVPPFSYEAYVRGELALEAGQPDQAVLQLELATAAPEEDAFLLARLADAQAAAGDRAAAQRSLAEAERVDACQPEVWLTRGKWAETDGDQGAAEAAYRRALSCARDSERAQVALYRLLRAAGQEAEALKLASEPGAGAAPARSVLFLQALASEDVAAVRFALDSWLDQGGLSREALREAQALVLARDTPTLALTFKDLRLLPLTVETRAMLAAQSYDRPLLRALLAEHGEAALGGPEQAARLALSALDYERAELYANLPAQGERSDALRALEVEALSALGQHAQALDETRKLQDPALRRKLARAQLTQLGLSALATALAREDQ